ncbi:16S rRNA (cytosine(1402)-N(4))-methyltransferase RsmH [Candidatus Pelagibacter sp.]|nr:16S rRNA (cytosine(1402)-N(4))-methyltransferase RsmH [Candidatus Pelagibacter sp.]
MNATIKLENVKHFPVLLEEVTSIISPLYGGTFIDCTFGQGGYSKKILEDINNKVFAIDRDPSSIEVVNQFKKKYQHRFEFKNKKFSEILNINKKIKNLKGIIFDLGYSTTQIKDPKKGLSFNNKGKLNMQMGLNNFSAHDLVNKLDQRELSRIFKIFGEENSANPISRKIIEFRKKQNISTEDLVNIINFAKRKKFSKIHNATKVFQALRIIVNNEISELVYGLINSFKILPVGGVIIIITFHSIEDRIVKFFLKNYSENKNLSRYLPSKIEKKNLFKLVKKNQLFQTKKN